MTQIVLVGLTGFIVVLLFRMYLDRPRCRHVWQTMTTTVVAPRALGKLTGATTAEEIAHLLRVCQGRTVILFTCTKCGAFSERIVAGQPSSSDPPDQDGAQPEKTPVQP